MRILWILASFVFLGAGLAAADRIYEQLPTHYRQVVEASSATEYLEIYNHRNQQRSKRRRSEQLQTIDLYLEDHGYFTFVKVFVGKPLSPGPSEVTKGLLLVGEPFWRPGSPLDKNSCVDNDFEYAFRFQGDQGPVEAYLSLHCLPKLAVCSEGKGCFYRNLTPEAADGWAELVELVTGEKPLR